MSLYVSGPSCDAETWAWNLWTLPAPRLAASGHMQLPFPLCFFCDNKQVQFSSSLFDDHVLIFNETGIDMAAERKQDHKHVRVWGVNSTSSASQPSKGEAFLCFIGSFYHGGSLPRVGKNIPLIRKRVPCWEKAIFLSSVLALAWLREPLCSDIKPSKQLSNCHLSS